MRYLSRIDSARTHCWWVRIGTPGKKNYVQGSFTDAKFGDKKTSFDAAIKFIEEKLIERNIPFDNAEYLYEDLTK